MKTKEEIEELKKDFLRQKAEKKEKEAVLWEKMVKDQIKFEDCKEGYTYHVAGRNFTYAIFHTGVFYGIRLKWYDEFIAWEIHWDKDENHGTVRPKTEIEKTPDDVMEALKYYLDRDVTDVDKKAFETVRDYLKGFKNEL